MVSIRNYDLFSIAPHLAIAKIKEKLVTSAFKSEKERQLLLSRRRNREKSNIMIAL